MAAQQAAIRGAEQTRERRARDLAAGEERQQAEPVLTAEQRTALQLQRLVGNRAVSQLLGGRAAGGAAGSVPGGVGASSSVSSARLQRSALTWAPKVLPAHCAPAIQRDVKLVRYNGPNYRENLDPDDWGMTDTEQIIPNIAAEQTEPGTKAGPGNVPPRVLPRWAPRVGSVTGQYSLRKQLLAGVTEVLGPGRNTTKGNWQHQVENLNALGEDTPGFHCDWYMVNAVGAHEGVHKGSVGSALEESEGAIKRKIEGDLPRVRAATPTAARTAFKADPAYKPANDAARLIWDAKYVSKIDGDHTGMTPTAEHAVVDPMITKIRKAYDPDYKA